MPTATKTQHSQKYINLKKKNDLRWWPTEKWSSQLRCLDLFGNGWGSAFIYTQTLAPQRTFLKRQNKTEEVVYILSFEFHINTYRAECNHLMKKLGLRDYKQLACGSTAIPTPQGRLVSQETSSPHRGQRATLSKKTPISKCEFSPRTVSN